MKSYAKVFMIVMLAGAVAGCADNQTKIGEGAGMGGLLGAAIGGIVGHQSGDGAAGALIGGAVGATGGALVGSQMDKNPSPASDPVPVVVQNVHTVQAVTAPLALLDIVALTKQGVNSDEIIGRIKGSNSKYYLNADDVEYLHREGVSQRIIEVMQTH